MNNGGRESNVAINNTWRHVAAVFPENATNLDSIKFYVDGVETGYASSSTTMPQTGDYLDVRLGNDHSNRRLNGSMDEARISQSNDPQTGSRQPTIIKNQVPPL